MLIAPELPTAKPYLLRALHEWCCDQRHTPYLSVFVDHIPQVPRAFVRDNEITLNLGPEATNGFLISNEAVMFKARFGGVVHEVYVPITHVMALFAKETQQGMAFPFVETGLDAAPSQSDVSLQPMEPTPPQNLPPQTVPTPSLATDSPQATTAPPPTSPATSKRPNLTRIK